jgi:hypothetical protein
MSTSPARYPAWEREVHASPWRDRRCKCFDAVQPLADASPLLAGGSPNHDRALTLTGLVGHCALPSVRCGVPYPGCQIRALGCRSAHGGQHNIMTVLTVRGMMAGLDDS